MQTDIHEGLPQRTGNVQRYGWVTADKQRFIDQKQKAGKSLTSVNQQWGWEGSRRWEPAVITTFTLQPVLSQPLRNAENEGC